MAIKADPKAAHVAQEFVHDAPLITCRFDPMGRFVFATAEDRAILRWDLATSQKTVFTAHDSWVGALAFTPDGTTLVSGGYDDTLIWWSATAEKPAPLRKVKAHAGWIRALAVSKDGKYLASAGNDRVVKLWNLADGAPVREFPGHNRDVYSLLFHPSGQFLLSGDLKGQVHQWEVASGKLARKFEGKDLHSYNGGQGVDFGGVRSLALTPDGKQLLAAGLHKATNPLGAIHEPIALRFEWDTAKLVKTHVTEDVKQGVLWRTITHPDGPLIGCSGGGNGGFLLFWTADAEKPFHKFSLGNTAREMDLHPDGVQIATAHYDKKLRLTKLSPKPAAPAAAPAKKA